MQEDDLAKVTEHCLAAIARMEQRNQQLAQQIPAIIEEQTARWLRTSAGQIETAARAGLEPAIASCQKHVQGMTTETDKTVKAMQGASGNLSSTVRWLWIGACVSLLFSIVALGGTYEMLYGSYQTRYDALKSQVTYLDAVNRSDVVPCGDGQLCARIDEKSPRVGDKKQYRVVSPRQ
jgi:hypothetical protein